MTLFKTFTDYQAQPGNEKLNQKCSISHYQFPITNSPIYIQTKQSILAKIRQVLRPNGYLFLGGGETTVNLDSAFEPVQFEKGVCYRSLVTT
ncbi:hypothetical protein [Tychonema sp. BBK16]|uniref:hypothetical protein n=1 Tax=Tychonema sp. BBK16 TaxID=2699888 RepID=UPI0038D34304